MLKTMTRQDPRDSVVKAIVDELRDVVDRLAQQGWNVPDGLIDCLSELEALDDPDEVVRRLNEWLESHEEAMTT